MFPIIAVVALIAGIASYWDQVRSWVEMNVIPFVHIHFPQIEEIAREAFTSLDNVVVNLRNAVRQAWARLREVLLKVVVELERVSTANWIRRVKSWMIKNATEGKATVRETEETMNWDELPPDVREAFMKKNITHTRDDYTAVRDAEILSLGYTS